MNFISLMQMDFIWSGYHGSKANFLDRAIPSTSIRSKQIPLANPLAFHGHRSASANSVFVAEVLL